MRRASSTDGFTLGTPVPSDRPERKSTALFRNSFPHSDEVPFLFTVTRDDHLMSEMPPSEKEFRQLAWCSFRNP